VVSRLSFGTSDNLSAREAAAGDRNSVKKIIESFNGSTKLFLLDKEYDTLGLPGFIASTGKQDAGVLIYSLEPERMVLVKMEVLPGHQGLGVGKALLEAAMEKSGAAGIKSIATAVSNDDLSAIYFYQKNGFQIYEVKPGIIADRDGMMKAGFAGIPCRDEIRLRLSL